MAECNSSAVFPPVFLGYALQWIFTLYFLERSRKNSDVSSTSFGSLDFANLMSPSRYIFNIKWALNIEKRTLTTNPISNCKRQKVLLLHSIGYTSPNEKTRHHEKCSRIINTIVALGSVKSKGKSAKKVKHYKMNGRQFNCSAKQIYRWICSRLLELRKGVVAAIPVSWDVITTKWLLHHSAIYVRKDKTSERLNRLA